MRISEGISSIKWLVAKFEDGTIDEVGYAHLCDLITRREVQLRTLTTRSLSATSRNTRGGEPREESSSRESVR